MRYMIFFDMVQTVAFATALLFIGSHLCKRVSLLSKYNIPAPVVGGLIFAFTNWGLQNIEIGLRFDTTLQDPFMIAFFTSIGLGASLKILKEGGKPLVIFLIVASVLLFFQNMLAWGLSIATGLNPLLGLLAGSVTMTGGHGTGATFARFFTSEYHLAGAMELAMAAATFGLVSGSLIGGPLARRLIVKNNLKPSAETELEELANIREVEKELEEAEHVPITTESILSAIFQFSFSMGLGAVIYGVFLGMNIKVPTYLFALFAGIAVRNVAEFTKLYRVNARLIDIIGSVSLSLFLSMALMSLRLWELAGLAVPMLVILSGQVVLMLFYAYFVTFRFMGGDYDAAVLCGGHCGFGLGATPNAIANMQAITNKYGSAPRAFFIVSIVGAFFIDVVNAAVIQLFVSFMQ